MFKEIERPNENSAILPLQIYRKSVIYENQGGDALHHTNQMMRIAGNNNPTRYYIIWSNVLGDKEA